MATLNNIIDEEDGLVVRQKLNYLIDFYNQFAVSDGFFNFERVDVSKIKKDFPTGQFLSDDGSWKSLTAPSVGINQIAYGDANGHLTSSPTLYRNPASGFIGVNNSTPLSMLDVSGDIQSFGMGINSSPGAYKLNVYNNSDSYARFGGFQTVIKDSSNGFIRFNDSGFGDLKLSSNTVLISSAYKTLTVDSSIGTKETYNLYDWNFQSYTGTGINFFEVNHAGYNDNRFGISCTPASSLDIKGKHGYTQLRLRTSYTPNSANDANGSVGDTAWDTNYFYLKTPSGWGRLHFDYSF